MIAVAVRHRVQVDVHQIRRQQRRRHKPIHIEPGVVANRLARVRQVGIDSDQPALRALDQEAGLAEPPEVIARGGTRRCGVGLV